MTFHRLFRFWPARWRIRWLPTEFGAGPGTWPSRGSIHIAVPFQGTGGVMSSHRQGAAVLSVAPEGTRVAAAICWPARCPDEQDLARLENDLVRAQQELESLEKAELPLELIEMESKRLEMQAEFEGEERFLASARGLQERGLMSDGEVEQLERKVAGLRTRCTQMDTRIELTRQHVHGARLAKARAALAAAGNNEFHRSPMALCGRTGGWRGDTGAAADRREYHSHGRSSIGTKPSCACPILRNIVRGYAGESELPWLEPATP